MQPSPLSGKFSSPKKENHIHQAVPLITLPLPPLQLMANNNLLSISLDFPTLTFHLNGLRHYMISCIWFLWISNNALEVHSFCGICSYYIFFFYIWVMFHWMDKIHLVYPIIIFGPLVCFHLLAIVNSVEINIRVKYLIEYKFLFLLAIFLGVPLLGHRQLFEPPNFSTMTESCYIPTNTVWGFQFFQKSLPELYFPFFFKVIVSLLGVR